MGWSRPTLDVRGPMGLLGAGLIAAAAGLMVAGVRGGADVPAAEEELNLADLSSLPVRPETTPSEKTGGAEDTAPGTIADMGTLPIEKPQGRPSPVMDPEPAPLPPDDEELAETPSPVPQVTIQKNGSQSAQVARTGEGEVVFIVRLRGAPEVDVITRNFKRDPAATHVAWLELIARIPVLADFELVGASYSGEMRLSRRLKDVSRESVTKAQQRLLAIEGVAYADPDYIAHPGQKDAP